MMSDPATDPSMLATVTDEKIIETIFGRDDNLAWVCQGPPWLGDFAPNVVPNLSPLTSHYISLSTMGANATTRSLANAKGTHLLTFDDVGVVSDTTKALLSSDEFIFAPPPTMVVETSRQNFQVSYRLWPPEDPERYTVFLEALKLTRFGAGVKPMSAIHYVRLPSGINTKKDKNQFPTKLRAWRPKEWYTLDKLAPIFDLPDDWDQPKAKTAAKLAPRETLPNETVIEVMKLIPNSLVDFPTYDEWIRIGNIFKGAAFDPGDPDLAQAWVDWCSDVSQKYDPIAKWETFEPDMTHAGSLRNFVAKHASHPKLGEPDYILRERRALAADKLDLTPKAASVFTVVDDGTVPPPSKAERAKGLKAVVADIRAARPAPTVY